MFLVRRNTGIAGGLSKSLEPGQALSFGRSALPTSRRTCAFRRLNAAQVTIAPGSVVDVRFASVSEVS